jgi:putative ABC transport system ATP-binding protein
MPVSLFDLRGVGLVRDGTEILRSVDLDIPATGITVIVGVSGAGKSTLLRCCNRLEAPTSGSIRYRGVDLAEIDPLALRRRCAMVFQAPVVFAGTVLDNLRVADPTLTEADADRLLARAGLAPSLRDRDADGLSGGEAQRLVVARALATGPEVLLADEATSALDAGATTRLEALARALADDGMPVVWVTHDLDQMARLADHLVVMADGAVLWSGRPGTPEAAEVVDRAVCRQPVASDEVQP